MGKRETESETGPTLCTQIKVSLIDTNSITNENKSLFAGLAAAGSLKIFPTIQTSLNFYGAPS